MSLLRKGGVLAIRYPHWPPTSQGLRFMYMEEERLTKGTYHKEDNPTLRVLSLGAGVQSSTVLLMMINGEIKPADVCIFADTGNEPKEVYEHLNRLKVMSTIPIHVVGNANIVKDVYDDVYNVYF